MESEKIKFKNIWMKICKEMVTSLKNENLYKFYL